MTPESQGEVAALERHLDCIAELWYRSIEHTSFSPHRPVDVRLRLRFLAGEAVTVLATAQFDRARAEAIGAAIAKLHFMQPAALGATQELLARELAPLIGREPIADAQGRLASLLGSVASGFFAQSRATILEEQEEIRQALFEAQTQAEAARVEAEAALRTRNDFLSAVSHDLRAPITTVKGRTQLLRYRILTEELSDPAWLTQQLARIDSATIRMERMIGDLLDLSYLQAGIPLPLHLEETDIVALVAAMVDEYREVGSRHHFEMPTMASRLVGMWDRERLERVIGNLLSNSLKYSEEGSTVTVEVGTEGEMAVVSVLDEGRGIPASDLPHVFDWFRRATNARGRAGTGIGLAGARQILEQHGGTISIESREGVGTRVMVRLPTAGTDRCQGP